MVGRLALILVSALVAMGFTGCEDDGNPIFIGGESDGDADGDSDGDADGDSDGDGDGDLCTGEDYPCGPYGTGPCEVIRDIAFVPANDAARALAGEDGLLRLSDVYADDSNVGLLLFGTAGWCTFCVDEEEWLEEIYSRYQDVDGQGSGVEFIGVMFENNVPGQPATLDYVESYAARHGITFPMVADTRADVLYYFDSQGTPGNIMIDVTQMRIHRVIQGFDRASIQGTLNVLDGTNECR
jgi:thiol-disulfide isomerase/thioredoxin